MYRRRHTLRGAVGGLVIGVVLMTAAMLLWNYFITPIYMGYPREAVAAMLVPVFLPFNLIKGTINAAVTMLVYKPVSRALQRSGLIASGQASAQMKKENVHLVMIGAAVLLVSCILAILVIRGVL